MVERKHGSSRQPPLKILWACWLVPVGAWAMQLFASYALVEWYCQSAHALEFATLKILLIALTILCILVAATATLYSFKWNTSLRHNLSHPVSTRNLFMTSGGVLLGGFLTITIFLQGWPSVVLPICSAGGAL